MTIDPLPADIVSYEDALARFHKQRPPAIPGDTKTFMEAWQAFLFWRIAEQLERLADYQMMDATDEPPVEPWRDNGEDDE